MLAAFTIPTYQKLIRSSKEKTTRKVINLMPYNPE